MTTLREHLSSALRCCKREGGYTYKDIMDSVNISKTTLTYALNGGDKVSLDSYQELFDFFGFEVGIFISNLDTES